MKAAQFKGMYNYLVHFTRILSGKDVVRHPVKCLRIKCVPVTTAWRVLTLWKETAFTYVENLLIY